MKNKPKLFIICQLLLFIGGISVAFTGCRMNYSFSGATVPTEAKTISILYFKNYAPLASPSLSQTFTEALKDYFASQTRLALTEKNGDLNFEGSISNYTTTPVAIQSTDQAALTRLTITVDVKYTNKLDDTKNFETSFSRFADYSNDQNLSAVETELIQKINRQLADDIFNKALNNW